MSTGRGAEGAPARLLFGSSGWPRQEAERELDHGSDARAPEAAPGKEPRPPRLVRAESHMPAKRRPPSADLVPAVRDAWSVGIRVGSKPHRFDSDLGRRGGWPGVRPIVEPLPGRLVPDAGRGEAGRAPGRPQGRSPFAPSVPGARRSWPRSTGRISGSTRAPRRPTTRATCAGHGRERRRWSSAWSSPSAEGPEEDEDGDDHGHARQPGPDAKSACRCPRGPAGASARRGVGPP